MNKSYCLFAICLMAPLVTFTAFAEISIDTVFVSDDDNPNDSTRGQGDRQIVHSGGDTVGK